jgi:flagellar hook protein FlgE
LASVGNLFGGTNPSSISIGASDPLATGAAPRWADGLGIDSQDIQIGPGQCGRRPDPV